MLKKNATDFTWRLENKAKCYSTLVDWWRKHEAFDGKLIPYNSMPNRVFTVSNTKKDVYGKWSVKTDLYSVAVYATDSNICGIGWITSNPYAKIKEKYKALEFLYDIILNEMGTQGFDIVLSKTKQTGLMRTLKSTGFINIEPNTNVFLNKTK